MTMQWSYRLINLTSHMISLANAAGEIIATFLPSGVVARCTASSEVVQVLDLGVPFEIRRTTFGAVDGIPPPESWVFYITSTLVAQRANRTDVVSPDTGPTAVRRDGQVVAVRAFQTG
jgi:hypothetical protein